MITRRRRRFFSRFKAELIEADIFELVEQATLGNLQLH